VDPNVTHFPQRGTGLVAPEEFGYFGVDKCAIELAWLSMSNFPLTSVESMTNRLIWPRAVFQPTASRGEAKSKCHATSPRRIAAVRPRVTPRSHQLDCRHFRSSAEVVAERAVTCPVLSCPSCKYRCHNSVARVMDSSSGWNSASGFAIVQNMSWPHRVTPLLNNSSSCPYGQSEALRLLTFHRADGCEKRRRLDRFRFAGFGPPET
jgi:hypothetical protein